MRDAVRSCTRGLGPPLRPLALPLHRLGELPLGSDPWAPGGPIGPRSLIIAGAWFLMRELELSTTRAILATITIDASSHEEVVTWHLPASKNDQSALGAARTHGHCCSGSSPSACPVCAVKAQHELLRARFPHRCREGGFDEDLPLFPTASGGVAEKTAVAETISAAAGHLGCPLVSPDGAARISGHSLRITGAQGLARAGVDAWAIQLLGRWGSATVLQYIQDVPLERSASWARRALSRPLDDLVLASSGPQAPLAVAADSPLPVAATRGLRCALPGALEEARAGAASSSASASIYVESEKGFIHCAPADPSELGLHFWATTCGWKFASSRAVTFSTLPERAGYKFLCAKCFPSLRAERKRTLGLDVGGQAGESSAHDAGPHAVLATRGGGAPLNSPPLLPPRFISG